MRSCLISVLLGAFFLVGRRSSQSPSVISSALRFTDFEVGAARRVGLLHGLRAVTGPPTRLTPGSEVRPCPALSELPTVWLCMRSGDYFFCPASTRPRRGFFLAILLLLSGVERNPGPPGNGIRQLKMGLVNARSIVNKAALIHDVIADHGIDLLAITETWVYDDSPDVHKYEAAPVGFSIVHAHRRPRPGAERGHGGGVALIHRNDVQLRVSHADPAATRSFELLLVRVVNCAISPTIAVIYRPPASSRPDFVTELSNLIESGALGTRYIICGDLNCPGPGGTRGLVATELLELMDEHSLAQHVHDATCSSGNILDHVITSGGNMVVDDVSITDVGLSDHSLVTFSAHAPVTQTTVVTQSYRNWRRVDLDLFKQGMLASSVCTSPASTADSFATQLQTDVVKVLDRLAPVVTATNRRGEKSQWRLSEEAVEAKRSRRRLERRWRSTGLEEARMSYRRACRTTNLLINASRSSFYSQRVEEASSDPRALWKVVRNLLHPDQASGGSPRPGLCNECATFFVSKLVRVRTTIASLKATCFTAPPPERLSVGPRLERLSPASTAEVSRLLAQLPNKTSPLDYLHTSVLRACSDIMAPLICHLANLSFAEGVFPGCFKLAQVTPLLKKAGLDKDDPANYRPISNLNTISKVIERLVLTRLLPHAIASGSFSALQSAYRRHHSTETALLKIMDDLYRLVDCKSAAVLVGLDLSAAFDTVDHDILLSRLQSGFGVCGAALEWMRTYVTGRSQYVKVGDERSLESGYDVGVPQGSVLGPFLFSVYVSPISDIISSFGVQFHQYADDTQLYTAVRPGPDASVTTNLERCTLAVRDWFLANGMLLNPEKSEVMLVGTRVQARKFAEGTVVKVAGSDIPFAAKLKSLGIILDRNLTFDQHVQSVVKSCNYHIRAFRHIRPLLSREVSKSIACSVVGSRLDYCNALLYGATGKNIARLQKIQNSLARVVTGAGHRASIRPVLKDLHWLPIAERVRYKVALVTYRTLATGQPQYLADIVSEYTPSRLLRSSTQRQLARRSTNTVIGERAFSCASGSVWDTLPVELRKLPTLTLFKSKLKTHLFSIAYGP